MTESKTLDLNTIVGVKAGMTRIFDKNGNHTPVTIIKLIPNIISDIRTSAKNGYSAYQVAFGEKRESLVKKPMAGHLTKNGLKPNLTKFTEVKISEDPSNDKIGSSLDYKNFIAETVVDVTGVSKGKGFQGVQKRYNFQGGPATHGSHFHRRVGSIGNRATPGRVFPLKKMPGHMGSEKVTQQNLTIVDINTEKGFLLVKGSVPGSKNSFVKISLAVKQKAKE